MKLSLALLSLLALTVAVLADDQPGSGSGSEIQINVESMFGKTITLTVDQTDTIESVKAKLEAEIGFPADKQRLIFGGNEMENERSLQHYDIQNNYTIYMMFRVPKFMQIFVKTLQGKIFSIQAELVDTIKKVKAKLEAQQGIAAETQLLQFEGKSLEDDSSLQDYGIQGNSTIHLISETTGNEKPRTCWKCTSKRPAVQQ